MDTRTSSRLRSHCDALRLSLRPNAESLRTRSALSRARESSLEAERLRVENARLQNAQEKMAQQIRVMEASWEAKEASWEEEREEHGTALFFAKKQSTHLQAASNSMDDVIKGFQKSHSDLSLEIARERSANRELTGKYKQLEMSMDQLLADLQHKRRTGQALFRFSGRRWTSGIPLNQRPLRRS